jgi:hypothetical protein
MDQLTICVRVQGGDLADARVWRNGVMTADVILEADDVASLAEMYEAIAAEEVRA